MNKGITYAQAGVNIPEADRFLAAIKPLVRSTNRAGTLGSIGSFGGFFKMPKGMKDPVLVASTDGVGTKLMVAHAQRKHDTIGIDLVAMTVNDLITSGAEPLFFLDYFAMGKLKKEHGVEILKGIARGCRQAGCVILGGETAEMPGLYAGEDYDLAGFGVAVVDRAKVINGRTVNPGDVVLGLHSSGLHSNGYSLARKMFSRKELAGAWGHTLLTPTIIYVKPILALCRSGMAKAVANITGGGFYDNINRSIPKNRNAVIRKGSWPVPAIFREIQRRGFVSEQEMHHTFNMGIGMTVVVSTGHVARARALLRAYRVASSVIGEVTRGNNTILVQ